MKPSYSLILAQKRSAHADTLMDLLNDIQRNPFEGKGKPEPLKYELKGLWSRRITDEHRLVYSVADDEISIYSCRFHYKK
jgi:toxin-antitoxin system, toxin component, Txe/YoeB family